MCLGLEPPKGNIENPRGTPPGTPPGTLAPAFECRVPELKDHLYICVWSSCLSKEVSAPTINKATPGDQNKEIPILISPKASVLYIFITSSYPTLSGMHPEEYTMAKCNPLAKLSVCRPYLMLKVVSEDSIIR